MIPLWMFPLAIACGNTFVLKPSEQDPLTPHLLTKLLAEVGLPKGVFNVVYGTKQPVNYLLSHRDVKAVSFVGSVPVAKHIYKTGCSNFKRVQALAGAKNHLVVMPDADRRQAISALIGASVGAAGQRCMAISVGVLVGDAKSIVEDLKDELCKVKPGIWNNPDSAYGPLISPQAKDRVMRLIEQGKSEGAKLLLDGSDVTVPGFEGGNWVGPTLFSEVTPEMTIYQEEIFGPVLLLVTVDSLDEAIELINSNPYGNGTSIFTDSGYAARKFRHNIEVGQVGINIPIPVPMPFFSFTGWKDSFFGDQHAYGKEAVRFYTQAKTVTSRWFDTDDSGAGNGRANMTIQLK